MDIQQWNDGVDRNERRERVTKNNPPVRFVIDFCIQWANDEGDGDVLVGRTDREHRTHACIQ